MAQQQGWAQHAWFMNQLTAAGSVLLGGPLGDDGTVQLIVRAKDAAQAKARFEEDP